MELRGGLDREGLDTLIELLMEPTPASHVRLVLKVYRDRGFPFEKAWAQAMRSLPREMEGIDWWRAQFHRDKVRWRAAYERATAVAA